MDKRIKFFVCFLLFFVSALYADKSVGFFAFSPNSAKHFRAFSQALAEQGVSSELFFANQVGLSLQEKEHQFSEEEGLDALQQIVENFPEISSIVTDFAHPLAKDVHQVFYTQKPDVLRCVYYDNPETYVPGGYSEHFEEICQGPVQKILFANANLLEKSIGGKENKPMDLSVKNRCSIGFYPLDMLHSIERYKAHELSKKRNNLFQSVQILEPPQKVFVYVGGANEYFFDQAWPFFLSLLETMNVKDAKKIVIFYQRHPRASFEKDRDLQTLESWKKSHLEIAPILQVSTLPTDEILALADGVFYSQTSMGPIFILAGLKTAQINPEPFDDILVRSRISPCICSPDSFQELISNEGSSFDPKIYTLIGMDPEWKANLLKAFELSR